MKGSAFLFRTLRNFILGLYLTIGWFASGLAAQAPPSLPTHHVPKAVLSGEAKFLHPMPPSQNLRVNFIFPIRDQAAMDAFLKDLHDPSSASYQQFLTVAQFTERFAPTQQDYDSVAAFAQSNGMTVTYTPPNRLVLGVTATVADIERIFHVTMGVYQHPTDPRTFFAADREPTVDLGVSLWHIGGLDNFSIPQPMYVKGQSGPGVVTNATGSGPGGSFLGSDRRAAYYGQTSLTGSGQSVGLFQLDGYNPSDLNAYFANVGQTLSVPINTVLIDGASAGTDGDDTEQVVDIIEAASMAPGLSQILMYTGPKASFSGGVTDTDILNRMATDNTAKQISCSWAWKPADPTSDNPVFQQMQSQGQNFFVASGDNGSYPNSSAFYFPAEDPNIIAVGGTDLTTNGAGGSWQSEVAWPGGGGGISPDQLPIPSYQQQAGVVTPANGGSTSFRNVPDVAAEANTDNYSCANGICGTLGGTSLAAPTWAGYMALANQQAALNGKGPIGFLNPLIYSIGVGSNYNADFHDIASGSNGGFSAVTGYDLVTGWGSPNGAALITALTSGGGGGGGTGTLRPTFFQDDGNDTSSCSTGTVVSTGSGALNTTQTNYSISQQANAAQSNPGSFFSQSILTTWQAGSGFTTLTLFVDSSCSLTSTGSQTAGASCAVGYSTDGVNFSNIRSASIFGNSFAQWNQITDQIALSATQDLSKLRVRVCSQANSQTPGVDGAASSTMQVIDARTVGN